MNIIALIPAKLNSQSIPYKNLLKIKKRSLIEITIDEALKCKKIDKIFLSSESLIIKKICLKKKVEFFKRNKKYSTYSALSRNVVSEFIKKNKIKKETIIIYLQPTSPLRNYNHIDECIKKLITKKAHSIVSVTKVPHTSTPYSSMTLQRNGFLKSNYNTNELNNLRQMKPTFYFKNGAIYMVKNKTLMTRDSLYGTKILPYEMEKNVSIDIDDEIDFLMAEILLKRKELNVK